MHRHSLYLPKVALSLYVLESLTIEKLDHSTEKEEPTVEKVKHLIAESLSDQKR